MLYEIRPISLLVFDQSSVHSLVSISVCLSIRIRRFTFSFDNLPPSSICLLCLATPFFICHPLSTRPPSFTRFFTLSKVIGKHSESPSFHVPPYIPLRSVRLLFISFLSVCRSLYTKRLATLSFVSLLPPRRAKHSESPSFHILTYIYH